MVQWLRIRPATQGILVPPLVPHAVEQLSPWTTNNWACELQLLSPQATTTEARTPRADASPREEPSQRETHEPKLESSPRSLQLEKACAQPRRPSTAKNKQMIYKKRERNEERFISSIYSSRIIKWGSVLIGGVSKMMSPTSQSFHYRTLWPNKVTSHGYLHLIKVKQKEICSCIVTQATVQVHLWSSGCGVGHSRYRTFPLLHKVLLDSSALKQRNIS